MRTQIILVNMEFILKPPKYSLPRGLMRQIESRGSNQDPRASPYQLLLAGRKISVPGQEMQASVETSCKSGCQERNVTVSNMVPVIVVRG